MTDSTDLASEPTERPAPPAESPPDLRLRGDPPGVMRLSRKALATIGIIGGLGIGGALIYSLQTNGHKQAPELYNTDNRSTSDALAGAPKDYGQIPKLGPPLPGDLGRPIVAAQQRGEDVPVPPIGSTPNPPANSAANAAAAARQRIRQERDAARTSKVFLGSESGADRLVSASVPAPLPGQPGPAIAEFAAGTQDGSAPAGQAAKRAFLAQPSSRAVTATDRVEGPVSPNVLQAGAIIPAALITGIRSDLPGQITAQVTQNVYDSATGRILLIPQGSRLIGDYDSQISFGQNRVLLAWNRLILPGGRSIGLERQPGADAAGYAGLQDRTDYHWGSIIQATLISTLLGLGAEVGSGGDDQLVQALRQGTQNTLNQTGQQIVRRQLDVQPTLTIRPGFPLRVIVTRDLVLEPIAGSPRP